MGIEPTRDCGCNLSLVLKTRGPTRCPVTPTGMVGDRDARRKGSCRRRQVGAERLATRRDPGGRGSTCGFFGGAPWILCAHWLSSSVSG
jgi:hypothetical protein